MGTPEIVRKLRTLEQAVQQLRQGCDTLKQVAQLDRVADLLHQDLEELVETLEEYVKEVGDTPV